MKKFTFKSLLLLAALTAGGVSAWAQDQPATKTKYVLTAPKDIKSTDIVVIADTAALVAIQNDAAEGKAPSAGKIKLNDNKDQLVMDDSSTGGSTGIGTGTGTTDFSKLEWKVQADANDYCNFYVTVTEGEGDSQTTTTKYLYVTNADDGLRMGTPADGDVKAFGLAKDEGNNQADFLAVTFPGENDSKSYRYVGVKSQFSILNSWKTKASIDDDIKNTKIAFFVKKESALVDVTMTFPKANYEADYNNGQGTFTAPVLTKSHDVAVTYSSSNENVATVDVNTGAITLKKRGTAKITASAASQDIKDPNDNTKTITTEAAETSYTLRIDDSSKKGSQNNPYTPSGAIAAMKNLDVETGDDAAETGANYFVEGYVAKIGEDKADEGGGFMDIFSKNTNDSTMTYYISNDGVFGDVKTNTLKVSLGSYSNLANLNDRVISVGDKVKVVGPLVYASPTPANSSFGGTGTGTSTGTGTGTNTSNDKEFRMDATNYIHTHTAVLVKKDMQMIVNQEIEAENFASENGLYTINSPALSGTLKDSGVTIESSNESVAKVGANGKFISNNVGTTIITLKVPAKVNSTDYNLIGKFALTVVDRNVYPATADKYELVTDAASLADGYKLLIVGTAENMIGEGEAKTVAMSNTQNEADRGSVDIVVDGTTIKNAPADAQVVTFKVKNGKNYLNVGKDADGAEYYLYASSSEDDELKTTSELIDVKSNAAVTITIDSDKNATIKFGDGSDGTSTHNVLKYDGMMLSGTLYMSSFACFEDNSSNSGSSTTSGSSGSLPKLYRYVKTNTFDVTIGASGYKTFVAGEDFKLPENSDLKVLVVSSVENDKAQLADVTTQNIKANTAYILKGTAAETYTLTTATEQEATAPAANELRVSDASTGNGVYVLATKEGTTAFYKWNGGLLGAGRVYLPASDAARQFILIEEEATGITTMKQEAVADESYYNLSGQRVAQPQKGLYIVNGKKVIVK